MNDFVRVKSDNYVTIANSFLKDKNLSNKTKGVLAMILALPDDWDFCIKGMVSIIKDGEASLRSAINEMKVNGYCAMRPVRINNKIARWKYLFSGEKLTESLLCDFLQVENLNVENRAQYNNIINDNNKRIKKESDNKLSLSKKSGNSRFVKPTIEQIESYIKEKDYHFDAEQFFYFYESKGWVVGKNAPMKDWKSACVTWEGRRKREIKEKEDSEPSDARAPMDEEQWERNQRWMEENTPKYVGRISFDDFISMRGEVMLNSRIYGEILKEMHQSGYEGDIVAEFKRRNDERICSHG